MHVDRDNRLKPGEFLIGNWNHVYIFDILCQTSFVQDGEFRRKNQKTEGGKGLPLRIVAPFLDIDQNILSKIERGKIKAYRVQVVKLAGYYQKNENDLLVAWLSDKLVNELAGEDMALEALQVAKEKVEYNAKQKKL